MQQEVAASAVTVLAAMALVSGESLAARILRESRPSFEYVATVLEQTADALAYAHSQGVVHRDIKPANVMVDLASDVVKVTDFGIARIADSSRTRTGLVLGTPSFMSPEQMAGRRVDGRSDLYSLGVMLYQLLSGHLPHRAETMAMLMYEIANETPPDVRNWRPEIPASLARVAVGAELLHVAARAVVVHRHREVLRHRDLERARPGGTRVALECDILMTPHPSSSDMIKRMAGKAPLVDGGGCRLLRRGQALLVVERIDCERLAGLAAGDEVVEVTVVVAGPDLLDDLAALRKRIRGLGRNYWVVRRPG